MGGVGGGLLRWGVRGELGEEDGGKRAKGEWGRNQPRPPSHAASQNLLIIFQLYKHYLRIV